MQSAQKHFSCRTDAPPLKAVPVLAVLLLLTAFAARGERVLLGEAAGIIPDSVRVSPDGKKFAAVTVAPGTNKRRVIVNCVRSGGVYDLVAERTPIFSPDGGRTAFVASRDGKCFVVADGIEGRGYEIEGDRWPVADLIFSPGGEHLAYKILKDGKCYVVVNEKEIGPYEEAVAGEGAKTPGIWDFQFAGNYFSYRAKTGGGMVACRGAIRGAEIALSASREYESIGAGGPVWLRGEHAGDGDLFAFAVREKGKDFIALLPEPAANKGKKTKTYDLILPGSLLCAPNRFLGFTARDETGKWKAVICPPPAVNAPQGGNEWQACDAVGELMHAPDGSRWACMARIDTNVVMLVDGKQGASFERIVYAGTVFPAGDKRVFYVAVKDGRPRFVIDEKEDTPYRKVDPASIVFGPEGQTAYAAGDGKKDFVVLDGRAQPSFDRVWDLRFGLEADGFAYCAQEGIQTYIVSDGLPVGPYESIAPGSPLFSPDGLILVWAAMDEDGAWRVYANGKPGPAFDAIVSQLTFTPDTDEPVYVGRTLSGGRYSFAMVSGAGIGNRYTSIWMGFGGELFPRDHGQVEYFAKQGPVVYRETHPVSAPLVRLSDVEFEKASDGNQERPRYDQSAGGRGLIVNGISYSKGIGAHAPSELVYGLEAIRKKLGGSDSLSFTSLVGIDDGIKRGNDTGTVRCEVYADNSKLASSPLLLRDRTWRFDVAIPPDARTLRLVTSDAGDGKDKDWCDWIKAAVGIGEASPSIRPSARVRLPARWALLKGEGIRYNAHGAGGAFLSSDKAAAGWDFVCPGDGSYEIVLSYACHPGGGGSEFALNVGQQSLAGTVEETGSWNGFKEFPLGQVSLNEGQTVPVVFRLTKLVANGVNVGWVELKLKK